MPKTKAELIHDVAVYEATIAELTHENERLRNESAAAGIATAHFQEENLGLLAQLNDMRELNEKLQEIVRGLQHELDELTTREMDEFERAAQLLDELCGRLKIVERTNPLWEELEVRKVRDSFYLKFPPEFYRANTEVCRRFLAKIRDTAKAAGVWNRHHPRDLEIGRVLNKN